MSHAGLAVTSAISTCVVAFWLVLVHEKWWLYCFFCAVDMQMLIIVEQLMVVIVVQHYRETECFSPICVKAAAAPQCYTMCRLKSMQGRCSGAGWTTFEKNKKASSVANWGLQCGMRYRYRSKALPDPYSGSKDTYVLSFHYVATSARH